MSDHDQSVEAALGLTSAAIATQENADETPQMSEWLDHAVDPREHRDER